MHNKLWNKDFLLIFQANAVSAIGDLMYSVAIGYWVYQKTGSSGLMGLMSSISLFVTMFLSPFSGSVVDKADRKKMIVGIDAMQGVLMLIVGILAYMDALAIPGVLVVALLAALGNVFYSPAVNTLLLDIIPQKDMMQGRSLHSGMMSLINVVGSAFSGAMVAFFGVPLIVVINGISNLYSAFSELFVYVPKTVQQGQPVTVKGILEDSRKAVQTIFSNQFLKLFVPSALILNLLGAGPLTLVLPFCAEKGFTVDMYGWLISAYTAACMVCVLLLGIFKLSPRVRYWLLAIGFSGSVVFFVMGYFTREYVPMCILFCCAAVLNQAGNVVFNASLMLALPEENRGAILGFIQSAATGGTALSAVIYGLLGDAFPLYLVFAAGSAISLIPMIYLCFNPKTKKFVLEH